MTTRQKEVIPEIKAVPTTPEEMSWLEYQRSQEQGTLNRLEDAAKYLSGLSSLSLAIMLGPNSEIFRELRNLTLLKVGIVCWLVSIVFTLAVVFPFRYRYSSYSVSSIRKMNKKVLSVKLVFLIAGTLFFLAGIGIITYIYLFGYLPVRK